MYDFIECDRKKLEELGRLLDDVCFTKVSTVKKYKKQGTIIEYAVDKEHLEYGRFETLMKELYVEKQYGLKLLSKHCGSDLVTYSRLRSIVKNMGLLRTGQSVVTSKLKEVRSKNAQGENNPWFNWPENIKMKDSHHKHHLCGWFTDSRGRSHYLRSSYEYAYAKYLDDEGVDFAVESKAFLLSDGRRYRPDFFLFKDGKLDRVVEVKARYVHGSKMRIDKFNMFKEEYSSIPSDIVYGKELFALVGRNQAEVLKEWKIIINKENDGTR